MRCAREPNCPGVRGQVGDRVRRFAPHRNRDIRAMDLRQGLGQLSRRFGLSRRHAAADRFLTAPLRRRHTRIAARALTSTVAAVLATSSSRALILAAVLIAPAHAAPTEWLQDTVLADCQYCQTDAFSAERRRIANQVGPKHDPASGMGYVVTVDGDGVFVWGRSALVGTGNLIRTDAHVLFAETGLLKLREGKIYFEPMHHGGVSNLIEI